MKLCILCLQNPAIANSHVVPKFVVRRLKQGTPHGTLRHSENLTRPEQDGWKRPYLCADCEARVGKWKDAFCRDVYEPLMKAGQGSFALHEKLALCAVSMHLRCMWLCMDLKPQVANGRVVSLYERLRAICLCGAFPADGIHSWKSSSQ